MAYKVSAAQLRQLAEWHGEKIASHRDGSRSFYLEAPGGHRVD